MAEQLIRFEYLPNELIIELFKYCNIRDLFRSFYNLNIRLNNLIQSLNHLSITISSSDQITRDDLNEFIPYLNTLFLDSNVSIDLSWFTNLRRLILRFPLPELLAQLNARVLPVLEHLSVIYMLPSHLMHIAIFSNDLPRLKSCSLVSMNSINTIAGWTRSLSLRILKVGLINLLIYNAILTACPNLYFLQINISTLDTSEMIIKPHMNLRRLKIRVGDCIWSWEKLDLRRYVTCVPKLEQLSVRATTFASKIQDSILDYDWLASIILVHLSLLTRFFFYFHVLDKKLSIDEEIFNRIEKNFKNAHQNRYRSRLVIVRLN